MGTLSSADLFERIRENHALVGASNLPDLKSSYWSELISRGRQEYQGKGDFIERDDLWENFRNNVISKGLDNANVPEEALPRAQAKWKALYQRLAPAVPERLRFLLGDGPIGNPRSVEVDGFPVTQSSLEYAFMLTHLEPYLEQARVVVDIGGGYGGMARAIKLVFPQHKIVLLDLPEVNAIQTYFLARTFPRASFLELRDAFERPVLDPRDADADFIILPGPFIERLEAGSFDLVINTRSMMEMDPSTVAFYIGQVQSKLLPEGCFYCLNRYVKKTRLKDYPFDERWYVSYSRPWPSFVDENPHHELVAVRAGHPVRNGLREHLAELPPHEGLRERIRGALRKHRL